MNQDVLIVRPADHPQPLNVIGTSVTVLADNPGTGGMGFTMQQGSAGAGPPPHCHPWDEAFFVLDGTIEFTIAETTAVLETGSLVCVPAGTTHAFNYGSGGGRMLEITGSSSRSAAIFGDLDREMPQGVEVEKVVEVFGRYGAQLMT